MNRRDILRLFGGVGSLASSGVSVSQVAKAVGASQAVGAASVVAAEDCVSPEAYPNAVVKAEYPYWEVLDRAFERHGIEDHSVTMHRRLPARYNKKSWSPVFRESMYIKDIIEINALRRELERNQQAMEKIGALLGIK